MNEPDDTPTRLQQIQARVDDSGHITQHDYNDPRCQCGQCIFQREAEADVDWLLAEVSRLQQEHAKLTREWKHAEDRRSDLVVDNRKLLEENALLRRSLEMLTKQMAQDH